MYRKIYFLLIIYILSVILAGCQQHQENPVSNGELFIQPNQDILNLDGDWIFYPGKLLDHSDVFIEKNLPKKVMKVPGYWPERIGYGTYQLTIHFPKNKIGETIAIDIPQIFSAYKLWINDELVLENGKPEKTKDEAIPKGIPQVVYYPVSQEKTQILLQVSNFNYHHAGIMGSIYIGDPAKIDIRIELKTIFEWFNIGAFIMIGINHLQIFYNRRKNKIPLYFGLFCVFFGIRILFIGQSTIYEFIPDISWNLVVKINFLLLFCSIPLFIKYFLLVFSSKQKKIVENIVNTLSLCCAFVTIVTEPYIFTNLYYILYILLFITFSYILYLIIKGLLQKRFEAKVIGLIFLILIGTVINDLLYDAQIIATTIMTPFGFFLFITAQSFIISKQFARSFSKNELLASELETTQKEILFILGEITETRSKETGNHVRRVAEFSKLLALKFGLSEEEAKLIKVASTLHDVGKVGIPDSILNKPGKLTEAEFEIIKTHTTIGHQMLKHSKREILQASALIAYTHHEKYDGTGYPRGLKGEEIPLYGRITAIADVFDALSTDRVYKKAWDLEKIIAYFKAEKGKHFDPVLVDLFLDNINEFVEIKESFKD